MTVSYVWFTWSQEIPKELGSSEVASTESSRTTNHSSATPSELVYSGATSSAFAVAAPPRARGTERAPVARTPSAILRFGCFVTRILLMGVLGAVDKVLDAHHIH